MTKSYVLQALGIFSFDQMLNLSQVAALKVPMKKAAGAELIVWDDAPSSTPQIKASKPEADILPFKKSSELSTPIEDPNELTHPSEESGNFHSSEFMLWQRELSQGHAGPTKKDAVKGYSRATEMYVVKTPTVEGKEKIRFASTNGVLVNKKQA